MPALPVQQSRRVKVPISRMVGTPRPSSPSSVRPRVHELDFGGGIGAIAEFVLQALDINAVEASVGQAPRHEEARQPAAALRQHQMRVALRRGKKPFVPGDAIGAVARTDRASGVGPHIGTALLFGHAHADQAAALFLERDIARIVFAREQPRHPVARQPGIAAHAPRWLHRSWSSDTACRSRSVPASCSPRHGRACAPGCGRRPATRGCCGSRVR